MRLRTLSYFVLCIAFFAVAISISRCCDKDVGDEVIIDEVKIDTVILLDTIYIDSPVYVTKRVVDTFYLHVDSGKYVPLPIEQKEYSSDKYKAYVSGYRPSLDSISIFNRTEIVYIDRVNTVYKYKDKNKRWGVGIQAGGGFNLYQPIRASPYVGIGISYNIFRF